MKRIALTGGIACGKSLVATYLNECGVETIDADDIVHRLVPEDERRRLAKIVFRDAT
ncbi:MAG: dephospho-CoA kinase, partial [Kiritimatiellae bacterium]|nr:dephospho-CoA kinase [Kiritimatiellia bacterium]